ncbi:MAG: hypothetical protein ACLR8Y_07985 [Alistipes indistinctus]
MRRRDGADGAAAIHERTRTRPFRPSRASGALRPQLMQADMGADKTTCPRRQCEPARGVRLSSAGVTPEPATASASGSSGAVDHPPGRTGEPRVPVKRQ